MAALRQAVDGLEARLGPLRASPLYRTAPISQVPQPAYLNQAVLVVTDQSPEQLLELAHELEERGGRLRNRTAAPGFDEPRTLDIDLLVVGELLSSDPRLILPHPRMLQRRFVLAPLADIAPDLPIPPNGTPVRQLLADLDQRQDRGGAVERLSPEEAI